MSSNHVHNLSPLQSHQPILGFHSIELEKALPKCLVASSRSMAWGWRLEELLDGEFNQRQCLNHLLLTFQYQILEIQDLLNFRRCTATREQMLIIPHMSLTHIYICGGSSCTDRWLQRSVEEDAHEDTWTDRKVINNRHEYPFSVMRGIMKRGRCMS